MKQKFYDDKLTRYSTRCSICDTKVRGKAGQFRHTAKPKDVEFRCPRCGGTPIVKIESLIWEEVTFEIEDTKE